jgi:hypothetical protein|tara:strand:- start:174 stop:347 length:174 start_codon:yes stop_codon:yes gene_type:complete
MAAEAIFLQQWSELDGEVEPGPPLLLGAQDSRMENKKSQGGKALQPHRPGFSDLEPQ